MIKYFPHIALMFMMFVISIARAQSYTLDSAASTLQWTGYAEVGDYSQSGTLRFKSGTLSVAKEKITDFTIRVAMNSLTHENKELENHLKQSDFFFVSKYPIAEMTFIKHDNNNTFIAEISIRGTSEKIAIPLDLQKTKEGYKLKGSIRLDRTKFDIKYNSSSYFQDLGNYAIKNDFDLEYELIFKER